VHLANLGPGDLVGEISVVGRVPATATVTARSPVRALALPRAFAERLVDGVTALRGWLTELADQRALDTQLTLATPDEGPLT
jgi:CRP-like cAMP-binding protein